VEAFGACVFGGHADVVQARLRFENGCMADLTANRLCPTVRRTMQTWSEAGCWTADLQEQALSGIETGPELRAGILPQSLSLQPGVDLAALKEKTFERFLSRQSPEVVRGNALQDELRSFVHAVRNGTPAVVDGREGVAALEIAERVMESVRTHAWDATGAGRGGPDCTIAGPSRVAA
jgi:predicted dehydrogenase